MNVKWDTVTDKNLKIFATSSQDTDLGRRLGIYVIPNLDNPQENLWLSRSGERAASMANTIVDSLEDRIMGQ